MKLTNMKERIDVLWFDKNTCLIVKEICFDEKKSDNFV